MVVSGQLHAPGCLSRGKSPHYPLNRRLGGPQSQSERGGEEEISLSYREFNSCNLLCSPVTVLTDPESTYHGFLQRKTELSFTAVDL